MTEPRKPDITDQPPAAGRFVRRVLAPYENTEVYHGLYLPTDWQAGRNYPMIVEYPGNQFPAVGCTGKVDDCKLGFYQSGGTGFLWLTLPFVDTEHGCNADSWWPDLPATADYCLSAVRDAIDSFGADPKSILLTGYSRGAMACGLVGLSGDEIASLWRGLMPHSFFDTGEIDAAAQHRLARLGGRPTLITFGQNDCGKPSSLLGVKHLQDMGYPVQAIEIPDIAHSDEWITQDSPQRQAIRRWMAEVLAGRRPGEVLPRRKPDPADNPPPAQAPWSG
jgi:predicted esterase